MKIKTVGINDVTPFSKNPRKITEKAIKKVAESIKAHGFIQPILLNEDAVICIGHTRYEAAKILGMKEIPVVVKKMTEEQFMALNIADNKTNEFTTWNYEGLGKIFEEIDDKIFKFSTGFEEDEIFSLTEEEFLPSPSEIKKEQPPEGTPTSHVRMVQLYLSDQNLKDFLSDCEKVKEIHDVKTLTDAVILSVKNESHRT